VRERPISIEEKLYNEFKAERKFFNRVDTFRKFIRATDVETGAEYLNEMIDYFTGFLKESNQDKVSLITSYLIIKDLSGRFPELSVNLQINFNTIFESVEKVNALYSELKYKDDEKDGDVRYNLQSDFLNQIKLFVSGWQDYYVRLFPKALDLTILHSLKEDGNSDKIVSMIRNCFENYKENRSAVVWFYNNYRDDPLYIKAAIPLEKELITLIHIFDITFREMESHRNTAENKKINKAVYAILFGSPLVTDYIANAERENVVRIFTLLQDVKDLDPAEKLKLQNLIRDRFSDFKFTATTEKGAVSRTLLVTAAKYEEKQKQLSHIMEVEVPANSKEIAFALSLGDLRENAEYKAAKEKQDILNTTVSKLKGEIERAQLFDPATIDTSHISFGTKVTLFNATKQNYEVYTILGPWESDPDNYIISYLSPLGVAIINKRIGEKIDFGSDDGHSEFEIKEITAANI
jgi:transcription elongation factor GreA